MGLNFAIYVKLIGNYGEHRGFGFTDEKLSDLSIRVPWHAPFPPRKEAEMAAEQMLRGK